MLNVKYSAQLQDSFNPDLQSIIDSLAAIPKAHTSARLPPDQLNVLLKEFEADYFMYKGSVSTNDCTHSIMWLVTRIPISVSPDQVLLNNALNVNYYIKSEIDI